MNEYDSARMADLLVESHGLEPTDREEDADVMLLNTCSIREKAQEKVFSSARPLETPGRTRPELVIGVGGCVASQEGEAIRERAPYVDLVFGPQTLHRLPEMLDERRSRGRRVVDVSFPEIEKFDRLPEPSVDGPTAFVSVMEGCSKYCTFCVVPYTRGEEDQPALRRRHRRGRRPGGAGRARGQPARPERQRLSRAEPRRRDRRPAELLIRFVAAVDGIDRIRFTTSHPVEFSDALIEAYAEVPELVDHLHLPVQSGSDRILAR
jgi:tRNA-2-methylthio-N6-dimethylallyladenosine synthase